MELNYSKNAQTKYLILLKGAIMKKLSPAEKRLKLFKENNYKIIGELKKILKERNEKIKKIFLDRKIKEEIKE
jgi:hypothetical protein